MIEPERTLRGKLAQGLFRSVCIAPKPETPQDRDTYFQWRLEQAQVFLRRFGQRIDVSNKTVLDFGCGHGSLSFILASRNATRVVGIDIDDDRLQYARQKLATAYAGFSTRLRFLRPDELHNEGPFDIVVSEDAFEHYDEPIAILNTIRTYLGDRGKVMIGFGPLWKAPSGGHLGYMTRLPWAHLLFPERIILRERRRYRPLEDADTFSQVRGGLNKMTFAKFLRTVSEAEYEIESIATNVLEKPSAMALNVLRRLPLCREYFTINIYAVLVPRSRRDSRES